MKRGAQQTISPPLFTLSPSTLRVVPSPLPPTPPTPPLPLLALLLRSLTSAMDCDGDSSSSGGGCNSSSSSVVVVVVVVRVELVLLVDGRVVSQSRSRATPDEYQ
ncbi:hypothetical protein M0802_008801 [Mischocyttarus mexicanus]|nr:hypothetical protein M0802_008801 [Mischocyttarus mexicanus]